MSSFTFNMPQIRVMPVLRSRVANSWETKDPDDDNYISDDGGATNDLYGRQTSNPFYINMKQKGNMVMDMKPLKHYTDAPLYQAFWPFLMTMKIFGLFYNKEYIKSNHHQSLMARVFAKKEYSSAETNTNIPPLSKRITPSSIYSFLVLLVLFANLGRFCTIFEQGEEVGPILFQKFIMLGFFTLVSINGVTCFLACHKYSNIPEFFYEWARLHQEYPGMFCIFFI